MLQNKLLTFPFIQGLQTQLTRYRLPDDKIPQDLVACMMMGANMLRRFTEGVAPVERGIELSRPVLRAYRSRHRAVRVR